jgi:hypothetical protein
MTTKAWEAAALCGGRLVQCIPDTGIPKGPSGSALLLKDEFIRSSTFFGELRPIPIDQIPDSEDPPAVVGLRPIQILVPNSLLNFNRVGFEVKVLPLQPENL